MKIKKFIRKLVHLLLLKFRFQLMKFHIHITIFPCFCLVINSRETKVSSKICTCLNLFPVKSILNKLNGINKCFG